MQYKVLSCRFGAIPYFEPLQFAGDLGIFVARVLKGQKTTFWEAVREVGTMGQGRLDDSVAEVLKPLVIEAGFAERAHETEYEINQLLSRLIISACSKTGDIRDRVEAVLTGSSEIRELYDTLDEHRDYWLKVLVNSITSKVGLVHFQEFVKNEFVRKQIQAYVDAVMAKWGERLDVIWLEVDTQISEQGLSQDIDIEGVITAVLTGSPEIREWYGILDGHLQKVVVKALTIKAGLRESQEFDRFSSDLVDVVMAEWEAMLDDIWVQVDTQISEHIDLEPSQDIDIEGMIRIVLTGSPKIRKWYGTLDGHLQKVVVKALTIKAGLREFQEFDRFFSGLVDAGRQAYVLPDIEQTNARLKNILLRCEQVLARCSQAQAYELQLDKYSFEVASQPVAPEYRVISDVEDPDVVTTYTVNSGVNVDISAFRQEVLPTKIGLYHQEITKALVFAIGCVGGFALHEAAKAAGITSSDSYFRHETFAETAGQPASVDWLGWFEMLHDKAQQEAEQARLAQLQAAKARSLSKVSRMSTGRALGDVAALRQGGVQRTLQTV